jgi:GTP-binding protein
VFIDKAKIFIKSGAGGKGCISFLRAKFIAWGGPNGGNGGKGGDIYFVGSKDINTLFSFKYQKKFIANNGKNGEGCDKHGKDAEDLFIKVPIGTELALETGEIIEILDTEPKLVLYGGKGGIGNKYLANSVRQSPKFSIPAGASEEMFVNLQLKLLGDVGIIGMPNAGKSSFINSCTNANSMVANYAFTTLEPKLGTYNGLILVDIPGLIEGASNGKGLGFQFLSHIERCKMLIIMADISEEPQLAIEIVLRELSEYGITNKEYIIVLNKTDLITEKEVIKIVNNLRKAYKNIKIFNISIENKQNIKDVLIYLEEKLVIYES